MISGENYFWGWSLLEEYIQAAASAIFQNDLDRALTCYEVARERYPEVASGYKLAAKILHRLHRYAEAEDLLTEARKRFPDCEEVAVDYALVAQDQQRWLEAAERWQQVLSGFPDSRVVHVPYGIALRSLGRFEDADAQLQAAISCFPMQEQPAIQFAWVAHVSANWPEALLRWERVVDQFPTNLLPQIQRAIVLRRLKRFEEAESVLSKLAETFPLRSEPLVEYAMTAAAANDDVAALARWRALANQFPENPEGLLQTAQTLKKMGDLEGADETLSQAQAKFPNHLAIALEFIWLAELRSDLLEAYRRWDSCRLRFPGEKAFEWQGTQWAYVQQLQATENGTADKSTSSLNKKDGSISRFRQFILQFESLGSGCEFGQVQRHFGAEPLGLMRWSSISPEDLVRSLDSGFKGLGDVGTVKLWESPFHEYFLEDSACGIRIHTFLLSTLNTYDDTVKRQSRRLRFLKDKMLEDLQNGEKIFVYKHATRDLSDDEALSIFRALRLYSNCTLLGVREQGNSGYENGFVREICEGLYMAYIDALCLTNDALLVRYMSWLRILLRIQTLMSAKAPVL